MQIKPLIVGLLLLGLSSVSSAQPAAEALPVPLSSGDRDRAIAQADAATARQAAAQWNLMNGAAQARHEREMDKYREAVRAQHQKSVTDQTEYAHQQRAYAEAMAAWRTQIADCRLGNLAACNAPTPNPSNY